MQENNRFFQLVWRVNALAIFAIAVLGTLLGLYAVFDQVRDEFRAPSVIKRLPIQQAQPRQEEMRFGLPILIPGSAFVRFPLHKELKTSASYSSRVSNPNSVNVLFVNSSNGESKWLFKGDNRLIVNQSHVLSQLKSDQPVATSIVYTLVEKDTSGDERLSSNDQVSVGYSSPDGSTYTSLLNNIEKLYAMDQVTDDRLMILYAREGESRLATYALPNYTIVADTVSPKRENNP